MRLLVTRPEPDATVLRAHLIGAGHEVLLEPLLHVEFHPLDPADLAEAQALIATSRNAVRAIGRDPSLALARNLPIYVVGPGTAAAARALGLSAVIEGPRDARALTALIAMQADINAGPLLHLAGAMRAYDIGGDLRRLGFHVLEPVVYAALPAERLSQPIVERFRRGEVGGVLLFSRETARTYARLVLQAGLALEAAAAQHFCLSTNVANGLIMLSPPRIATAAAPNLKEMLALVARAGPQSR
jgi:uroporphyrinogen-III synthase